MALRKIHHVDIFVDDIKKVPGHFIDKLGFKPVENPTHGANMLELVIPACDEVRFEFHEETEEHKKSHAKEMTYGKPQIDHIGFEVDDDDIDKAYEELRSKGVEFKSIPSPSGRRRRLCRAVDADGRGWIQLQQEVK